MRTIGGRPLAVAAGLLACLAGCKEEETRPGLIADCSEPDCLDIRPRPIGGGAMASGSSGAGGEGGSSGMPPPGAGTLAGSVAMVVEPDLADTRNPTESLEVRGPGVSGGQVSASTEADGTLRLEGVVSDELVWVGVGSFDADAAGLFMDTLQPVDTSRGEPVSLLVMQRSVMELISQMLMSNPVLDPMRGHLILTYVDADGLPLDGVRVTFPAPEDTDIAYDAGALYSDQSGETSTRGTVVLFNLPASAYPGGLTSVVADVEGEPFDINVQVARGAVTIATVATEIP